MRVLISSVGTRGDVQPVIALALEVRKLGHDVRMCIPPNFTGWAAGLGFEARPIGIEMRAPRPGAPPLVIPDLIADQFKVVGAAAEGCSLIVGGGAHQYAARSIAELRGIAFVAAVYAPVSLPSADLAPVDQSEGVSTPEEISKAWQATRSAWNQRSIERVNANRAQLGLAPVDDVLGHILGLSPWLAADAALGPAPATPGIDVVQTGAWLLPDMSPLAPELEAFLDRGEAPVYLGLGSMPVTTADANRTLIDAARAVGRRVILSKGWADLDLIDAASDCIAIGDVNQQKLFPRLAGVVHHGGAGTTIAAARAGVPQVVTPMFGDQFYWGRRVRDLGIGLTAPFAGLSAETLAPMLHKALQPAIVTRALANAGRITLDGAAIAARRLGEVYG